MSHSAYPDLPPVDSPIDILVIAPHPDDAELGMGGTIAKLLSLGNRIGILDLTSGEPTPFGSVETRQRETVMANQQLGNPWRYNMGWTNRSLEHTLEKRHQLAGIFRLTRPRWIFAPYWTDAHPDHVAATEIVEAARFWSKLSKTDIPGEPYHPERIFYYYCIHLRLIPQPSFVVDISEFWDRKAAAINAYESQFLTGREQIQPPYVERFREEAGFWGRSIGVRYAEPFASREPIGLSDFESLT
jgi:N-acetylglucosamine malate deacetylase 1